jgi:DNA invertase Pin-like site-specific DNA recombinase
MQIGYMRVSKADGSQSTDLQRDALRAAGVASRRLYEDRASGRLDARPGLDAALKALRRGDTLIVWKLDRLGRDLRHLINVVHDLSTRSIGFKVLTGHGASIDTTTPSGKLRRKCAWPWLPWGKRKRKWPIYAKNWQLLGKRSTGMSRQTARYAMTG